MPAKKKPKPLALAKLPLDSDHTVCARAVLVLQTAHESADALLKAYDLVREQRGRPRGMTTDNEQDLLRSMLVMAAAGLDATVKQLIQDGLPYLLTVDEKAQNSFEKFVVRRLGGEGPVAGTSSGVRLVAMALTSVSPQKRLIAEYVDHLIGGSLQSTESLFEISAALGADPNSIGLIPDELAPIFATRNKIIHELDINLFAHLRTRNLRSQRDMIQHTNRLFNFASRLLKSVSSRLPPSEPAP